MKSGWPVLLAFALVAIVSILVLRGRAERAEAEVLRWHAVADSTTEWARDSLEVAAAEVKRARGDEQAAEALAAHAQAYTDTLHVEVERVRLVTVPDTCRGIVAARDSLIDRAVMTAEGWRAAYRYQLRSSMRLHRAYALSAWALDSVTTVLESRPKPRGKWTPRLSAFAGVWTDKSYDAGLELRIGHVEVLGGLCDGRRCGRIGVRYPLF